MNKPKELPPSKLKALALRLVAITAFKVGLGVMILTTVLGHTYYDVVKRRRPESAEVDKRKLDKPVREVIADLLLMVHQKTIDMRFKARGLQDPDDRVIILAGDEESIKKLGRWPWPRGVQAQILEKLMSYGARVIGYDGVFSEPDNNNQAFLSLTRLFEESQRLKLPQLGQVIEEERQKASTDWVFAQAIKKHTEHVVAGFFFDYGQEFNPEVEQGKMGPLWESFSNQAIPIVLDADDKNQQNVPMTVQMDNIVHNMGELLKEQTYQGYFNAVLDSDGVIRQSALVTNFGGKYFPSLALQMAAVELGGNINLAIKNNYELGFKVVDSLSILSNETGEPIVQIPVDPKGMLRINYAGPRYSYPHMSIAQLLDESDKAQLLFTDPSNGQTTMREISKSRDLKDKAFVWGMTAIGVFDMRNTPYDENYPGVETHANVLGNILGQNFHQNLPQVNFKILGREYHWTEENFMLLFLILFGILQAFAIASVGAIPGALFTAFLLSSGYIVDKILFFGRGYVLTTTLPIMQIGFMYLAVTFYKYLTEERSKKQIKGTFEKYVSPEIVNQILSDPSKLALGGEKRRMTVMFSDVRGFTTISEKMEATQLGDFLNSYLTPMTDLVFKNRGTLDKYMGDAIMAFWGAPIHFPDHAKAAARCALEMFSKLQELQKGWSQQGLPPIDIGIGLNTGEMSVGNMGSNTVRSYTVMGDSVNLGSRLEGINKDYGTHIVVSEFTYEDIKDSFTCREIDWVRVKGKEKPVKIFELVCEKGKEGPKAPVLEKFNQGYQLFRERNFHQALEEFKKAVALDPQDGPSLEFIDRCEDFVVNPPPADWNGVVVKKTK